MKCLVSTNVKDEHNIHEWIKYHLLLGFDSVLIWDDFSSTPVEFQNEKVKIIKQHSKKVDYMTDSVAYAKRNGYDWIIHIDGDEYLYLGVDVRLKEFMGMNAHADTMAILFPWVIFGSNNINILSKKGSCLEPFTKCANKTHQFIKPMARVQLITGVRSPHEFLYSQPYTPRNTVLAPSKTLKNFSVIQTREVQPISANRCFIAHYRFQSWDLFCHRKGRKRDDTQREWKFKFPLGKEPPAFFHADSNHVYFPHVLENFRKWSQHHE